MREIVGGRLWKLNLGDSGGLHRSPKRPLSEKGPLVVSTGDLLREGKVKGNLLPATGALQ